MLTLSQTFIKNDKPVVASAILLNSYNSTLDLTHLPDINQISWSDPKTEML
ncbi:unnamed protein product, partial [marine sediment metagenome]